MVELDKELAPEEYDNLIKFFYEILYRCVGHNCYFILENSVWLVRVSCHNGIVYIKYGFHEDQGEPNFLLVTLPEIYVSLHRDCKFDIKDLEIEECWIKFSDITVNTKLSHIGNSLLEEV